MTRTVLVTGSSRGFGATIACVLVKNGFKVVINYYKSMGAAENAIDFTRNLATELGQ